MTDDRWAEFIESAQDRFEDVGVTIEQTDNGTNNVCEFTLPTAGDRYKVVRENRPVVLDKKQHYSHRAGDTARTEYILSDTEFSHKIKVYKEDNYGEWEEISAERLGL